MFMLLTILCFILSRLFLQWGRPSQRWQFYWKISKSFQRASIPSSKQFSFLFKDNFWNLPAFERAHTHLRRYFYQSISRRRKNYLFFENTLLSFCKIICEIYEIIFWVHCAVSLICSVIDKEEEFILWVLL